MGDFSMTCSISGLGISGGTPVRCLLLTGYPYSNDDPRRAWIVRTPPLRARYNSYGSIEEIHKDDKIIADLWLRGLREDLIERGLGDNSVHDVPTAKDMSFAELLDAVRAGRVAVRQDAKHFWRRPRKDDALGLAAAHESQRALVPSLRAIEGVLAKDAALIESYPDPVSRTACENKFVVDEPVPHLVRVRFGRYQHGTAHRTALNAGLTAIKRAGFVGVVAAGSGRYSDEADLLVLPAPNAKDHVSGPQWDRADQDKHLTVAMAMVREDVWQALIHYPHSESVSIDCTNCGQQSWYHEKDRQCPDKSINDKPLKEHPRGSRYAHGPVFPDGVEHVVVPRDYGETVWYDLAAYRDGTRKTWTEILEHFSDTPKSEKEETPSKKQRTKDDAQIDKLLRNMEAAQKKEAARIAGLPAEERAKLEAERRARVEAWEAEEQERKANPRFGDFLINDGIVRNSNCPGAWLFRDSVPGVISVSEHLSMCLADKLKVPLVVLDAIAELSAVSCVIGGVGVTWKPAASTGPQSPEWDQHLRFTRTLLKIAEESVKCEQDKDEGGAPKAYATLAEVKHDIQRGKELMETKKEEAVRKIADDLRHALQEAANIAKRLDERQHFTGRIKGWLDLVQRVEEVLR